MRVSRGGETLAGPSSEKNVGVGDGSPEATTACPTSRVASDQPETINRETTRGINLTMRDRNGASEFILFGSPAVRIADPRRCVALVGRAFRRSMRL
jgi:hypothetical protein